MRRTELVDHIKGSYLKRQYLEAFLVQSAYIEGLLKIYADYTYWEKIMKVLGENDLLVMNLRARINKFGLNELIDFLHKVDLINSDQKKSLHQYREKRNTVLHELVLQISANDFDKDIKATCELGDKIIDDEKFKKIEKVLDGYEAIPKEKKLPAIVDTDSSISG